MSAIKWTGIAFEYFGKFLQADAVEDAIRTGADAVLDSMKVEGAKPPPKGSAAAKDALEQALAQIKSKPFRLALEQAVVDAEGVLNDALCAVTTFDRTILVPLAGPGHVLRAFFAHRLGAAAEAKTRIARRLIDEALARQVLAAVEARVMALPDRDWLLRTRASVVIQSGSVKCAHLLRVEKEFDWGDKGGEGYLLAHVVMPAARAGRRDDLRPAKLPDAWVEHMRKLEERLGRMSQAERDAIRAAWSDFGWNGALTTAGRVRGLSGLEYP